MIRINELQLRMRSRKTKQEHLQMSRIVVENKNKLIEELGYATGGGIYEALSFLVFRYISCADYGYLCNTTQEVSLCQRHRDFCALLDDDVIKSNIKKLSIETLKRYSIRNRSQLARLFIYKHKIVWILTAKTWIKQKIWKRLWLRLLS